MADTRNMLLRSRKAPATRPFSPRGNSLGMPVGSTSQWIRHLQKGFPFSALVHLQKTSGLPMGMIADLVQLPQRTLIRRRASGRLRADESERLLHVAGVYENAIKLFEGDRDAARRWLTTPRKELDNTSPLEFARTEVGAREVEDLIGRLEHGVFS